MCVFLTPGYFLWAPDNSNFFPFALKDQVIGKYLKWIASLKSMAALDEILCMQSQFQQRTIRYFIPENGSMTMERLSIRGTRDLGVFPAVLDDLNFKFSQGSMPPDPPSMFMRYQSVPSKKKATNKVTDQLPVHSFVYIKPHHTDDRKQKCKQGTWKLGELRGAKLFVGPTLPRVMLRFWCAQKAFFKKGSCVQLPYSAYWVDGYMYSLISPGLTLHWIIITLYTLTLLHVLL